MVEKFIGRFANPACTLYVSMCSSDCYQQILPRRSNPANSLVNVLSDWWISILIAKILLDNKDRSPEEPHPINNPANLDTPSSTSSDLEEIADDCEMTLNDAEVPFPSKS